MRLPILPDVLRIVPAMLKGREDAPVFLMAPFTAREHVKAAAKLARADVAGDVYLDVFAERCKGAESLEVGEEPFDPAKHLDAVPAEMQVDVAEQVFAAAMLSDEELGKSPLPSG